MTDQPGPASVRAGCAREPITPALGVPLAGYFHDRIAQRVRDDLFASAVVIGSGAARVALVSCDLIAMSREVADEAKAAIAAETGIPADGVLIGATHTHTGPELRADHAMPRADEWAEKLPGKIAAAVKRAAEETFVATLRPGRIDVDGYAFNRLFRMKDGSELFGRPTAETVGAAGPIDPELQTLSLVDRDGNLRALVVNFALHVDVIGGGTADFISADWPGELAGNISAVYGPEVVTVFLQGTCGDINHASHHPTSLPRGGPPKAVQLGRGLAGAAICAAERAEPTAAAPVAARIETLSIPYYTRDEAFLAELARLKARPDRSPFEQFTLARGESWPHDGRSASVPVQAMRIGDMGVVALPSEVFVRLGLEIKQFSPSRFTFVVELANADVSIYIPTPDQARRGAYGAKPILSRWLTADAGRRIADAAQVLLWRLWDRPA